MQTILRKPSTTPLAPSELILNNDGSVYHLALKNENIADLVITVGDPDRVKKVSSRFERIEFTAEHREFVTHTGYFKGERITVISSGIGPDNMDILVQELDAAVNIDPKTRLQCEKMRKLKIIRLGTSGALQADIPVDHYVVPQYSIGLDGTAHFYDLTFEEDEMLINAKFSELLPAPLNRPYTAKSNQELNKLLTDINVFSGITLTAGGFYAPQTRELRLPNAYPLQEKYRNFRYQDLRICNFEMETSMLFALGGALGHECAAILNIIANRERGEFSKNATQSVENLIDYVLMKIVG